MTVSHGVTHVFFLLTLEPEIRYFGAYQSCIYTIEILMRQSVCHWDTDCYWYIYHFIFYLSKFVFALKWSCNQLDITEKNL